VQKPTVPVCVCVQLFLHIFHEIWPDQRESGISGKCAKFFARMDITPEQQAAVRIVDLRLAASTKKTYRSKLNTMLQFFVAKGYAECIVSDEAGKKSIAVPLEFKMIQELFGWLSTNTSLVGSEERNTEEDVFCTNSKTVSSSCMQSYKSALSYWYSEKGEKMGEREEQWILQFVNGYKKEVADKKSRGGDVFTLS